MDLLLREMTFRRRARGLFFLFYSNRGARFGEVVALELSEEREDLEIGQKCRSLV